MDGLLWNSVDSEVSGRSSYPALRNKINPDPLLLVFEQ